MTPAQQYRKLVDMLEALAEAPPEPDTGISSGPHPGIDDATRQRAMDQVAKLTVDPAKAAADAGGQIPTIDAPNFKQAYAQAAKQGLKVFKWCGTYRVQASPAKTAKPAKPQSSGQPAPSKPSFPEFDWGIGPGSNTGGIVAPGVRGSNLPPSA